MAYNGLNLENVKNQNRSSILKLLNDHGPMSRKDISARLGLTPASVTTLCAELLAQNILVELGEVQQGNRAGRRKILLGINYTYAMSFPSASRCRPPASPCVTCGASTAAPGASPPTLLRRRNCS